MCTRVTCTSASGLHYEERTRHAPRADSTVIQPGEVTGEGDGLGWGGGGGGALHRTGQVCV